MIPHVWLLLMISIPIVVAIQNGTTIDDPAFYPYYVMLGNPHVCGGILISLNPAIVLTAAHCVADALHPNASEPNPYFAGYQHVDRKKHKLNPIQDWVVHPRYLDHHNNPDMHYDIALVKLKYALDKSNKVSRVALWPSDRSLPRFTRGRFEASVLALSLSLVVLERLTVWTLQAR